MPDINHNQFRLAEDGQVTFQENPTNPLPGVKIGVLRKGADILSPRVEITDETALPPGMDRAQAEERLQEWIAHHLKTVLEALAVLGAPDNIVEGSAAERFTQKLRAALGVLPRAALEDDIAALDETGRQELRVRRVRFGPVLVYLPALNKPAAVRLRALLWNLWHDKPLPATVPPDGVTSLSVAPAEGQESLDHDFYQAIGYPLYGPRAIRVDMLDRLICSIYDSADKGVFAARHDMAEWLGCSIPDLYAVIEALGHQKIPGTEQEAKPAVAAEISVETTEVETTEVDTAEVDTADVKTAQAEKAEESESAPASPATPPEKPALAQFRLRRGKAYGQAPGAARDSKKFEKQKPENAGKPPKKKFKDQKRRHPEQSERPERIMSAKSKTQEESPFAVLKALNVNKGE